MQRAWNVTPVTANGVVPTGAAASTSPADAASGRDAGAPRACADAPPRMGAGLLARAGLLSTAGFVPSDAPVSPGRQAPKPDEAAVGKWRDYDATVRTSHRAALDALVVTKGLKKVAIARARDLRARAEREEQTRQHAMSELLLEFGAGRGSAAASAEAYADLCARLVRNNMAHAGPLSPNKAMGKALSEYLSAVDHHGQLTQRCVRAR